MKAGLNPLAADLLNPILSAQFSLKHFILALQFGGNQAVIERSVRESMALSPYPETVRGLSIDEEQRFWTGIAAITPWHLEKFHDGVVARISTPISESFSALATVEGAGPHHGRLGSCTRLVQPSGRRFTLAADLPQTRLERRDRVRRRER